MRNPVLGAAFAAAALLIPAAATAADLRPVYKAPVVVAPPVYNWTGFYLGGHVGWAKSHSDVEGSPDGSFDNTGPQFQALRPDGWFGGGQIGFNWQTGNWVLGVEADLGKLGLDDSVTFFGPGSAGLDDVYSVEFGRYYTITGRLGVAFDRVLWYAKGGYVNAKITTSAGDTDGGAIDPTDFVSVTKNRGGWTLGGGVEWAFYGNWSVKAEYLYMKFEDLTVSNLDAGTVAPFETFTFNDKLQTIKVGVNYKFDWGKTPVMAKY